MLGGMTQLSNEPPHYQCHCSGCAVSVPLRSTPLPEIVLLTDENALPPSKVCTPMAFPEMVLLVKMTIDCAPFALTPTLALRTSISSNTALVMPAPVVLNAFTAALANEKNFDAEMLVVTLTDGPDNDDESVRMPKLALCASTLLNCSFSEVFALGFTSTAPPLAQNPMSLSATRTCTCVAPGLFG